MFGFSVRSWLTTTTPSAVMPTSSSNHRTPSARASRNPSTVFSGNSPRAPRWPMTSIFRSIVTRRAMCSSRANVWRLVKLPSTSPWSNEMQYTTLGRTGLRVSVAGLGTGGFSRIGIGQSEDHAVRIIREALDLGVNLIDTAAVYGTEAVIGRALRDVKRDSVVVCTKASKPVNDPGFTMAKIVRSEEHTS